MRSLTLLLLLAALLGGCGKRGPVLPLLQPLPAAPASLGLRQIGPQLLVSWDIPQVNQDGSPLTDLAAFELYRLEYDPARPCPECRDVATPLRRVDLDYLQDVRRLEQRLFLFDAAVQPGVGYRYRVTAVTRSGRQGASTTAARVVLPPPAPPTAVTAQGFDRLVRLSWQPPAVLPPGAELLGYNVYRSEGEQPLPLAPHNPTLRQEPNLADYGPENGRLYRYGVRSVVRLADELIESAFSEVVSVRPGEAP